jgi:hypothetical protein
MRAVMLSTSICVRLRLRFGFSGLGAVRGMRAVRGLTAAAPGSL